MIMQTWKDVERDMLSQKTSTLRRIEFVHAKKASGLKKPAPQLDKHIHHNKQTKGIYPIDAVLTRLKWSNVRRAGPGMHNHGNTCFLNSTLQCLVHVPPLVQIFLSDPKCVSGLTRTEGHNAAITILFKR